MPDATAGAGFARPDLTAFCRLDDLGLEVTGQRLDPDRAVLTCRVVGPDLWCRRCGCEGIPRDSVLRELAHEPLSLLVVLAAAAGTPSVGELAALVPILGYGLRGLWRPQLAWSIFYYVALMLGAALSSSLPKLLVPGTFWLAAIAIVWIIGGLFHRARRYHEDQRTQSLRTQRTLLARELHDTIAHELTSIAFQAEVAQNASQDETTRGPNTPLASARPIGQRGEEARHPGTTQNYPCQSCSQAQSRQCSSYSRSGSASIRPGKAGPRVAVPNSTKPATN